MSPKTPFPGKLEVLKSCVLVIGTGLGKDLACMC